MRIRRERDQTVSKDASTCWRYGLASSAGVGCISPATKSFCVAADGDQARGGIALVLLRMARPGALRASASTSARSRSASKRTGSRKKGLGSFNPAASFVARAEAEARRQP